MIRDVAAQCASLANDYGDDHGPNSPASFAVALYMPDPDDPTVLIEVPTTTTILNEDTGDETVVANGYARATGILNDGTVFPAPDPDTAVLTTVPIVGFPASLAEYPGPVTHWCLIDEATGTGWDLAAFPEGDQPTVSDAGIVPRPVLSIFYNDLSGDL